MQGFTFDRTARQWRGASFKTDGKFVVTHSKKPSFVWEVKEIGSTYWTLICKKEFSNNGEVHCDGLGGQFFFNRKSMRFLATYTIGYWNEETLAQQSAI